MPGYVAYASGKGVVWGGHSSNLDRLSEFFPVMRRRLEYFNERYAVEYILLDEGYMRPSAWASTPSSRHGLASARSWLYEYARPGPLLQRDQAAR